MHRAGRGFFLPRVSSRAAAGEAVCCSCGRGPPQICSICEGFVAWHAFFILGTLPFHTAALRFHQCGVLGFSKEVSPFLLG